MAVADTARLLASLELQDKFTATATKIEGSLGRLEKKSSTAGRAISTALGVGLERVAEKGVSLLVGAVENGISSLETLASATTSVGAAISQMGLSGKVSAAQVADWANQIEDAVGAAFDDKAITQATTTLIRFGKVTADNLKPAMVVMTDLATKTGSVDTAATLLARALADPEKAAGKLARAGVILTKEQQDQIKAMVKAGDTAGAQAALLDDLTTATKGAAAASQGPGARSMAMLHDAIEDAEKALAEGLLPVIDEVRTKITTWLKDPANLQRIKEFGNTLAAGFRAVADFAGKIPWSTIGDALKIGGQGAKAVLDAFVSMPAWVQTAVLTGWGLNKLSGGTLSGLVGELGKGLIKGVLGMTAGVVNLNAGVVNGGGGAGGLAGRAASGGLAAAVAPIAAGIAIGAAPFALAKLLDSVDPTARSKASVGGQDLRMLPILGPLVTEFQVMSKLLETIPSKTNPILEQIAYREQRLGEITGGKSDIIAAATNKAIDAVERARQSIVDKQTVANNRLDQVDRHLDRPITLNTVFPLRVVVNTGFSTYEYAQTLNRQTTSRT